jgi:hypothetical protein
LKTSLSTSTVGSLDVEASSTVGSLDVEALGVEVKELDSIDSSESLSNSISSIEEFNTFDTIADVEPLLSPGFLPKISAIILIKMVTLEV